MLSLCHTGFCWTSTTGVDWYQNVFQQMPLYNVKEKLTLFPSSSLSNHYPDTSLRKLCTEVYQAEQVQDRKKNYVQTIKFRN